jgi:hypothetical protein
MLDLLIECDEINTLAVNQLLKRLTTNPYLIVRILQVEMNNNANIIQMAVTHAGDNNCRIRSYETIEIKRETNSWCDKTRAEFVCRSNADFTMAYSLHFNIDNNDVRDAIAKEKLGLFGLMKLTGLFDITSEQLFIYGKDYGNGIVKIPISPTHLGMEHRHLQVNMKKIPAVCFIRDCLGEQLIIDLADIVCAYADVAVDMNPKLFAMDVFMRGEERDINIREPRRAVSYKSETKKKGDLTVSQTRFSFNQDMCMSNIAQMVVMFKRPDNTYYKTSDPSPFKKLNIMFNGIVRISNADDCSAWLIWDKVMNDLSLPLPTDMAQYTYTFEAIDIEFNPRTIKAHTLAPFEAHSLLNARKLTNFELRFEWNDDIPDDTEIIVSFMGVVIF